MGIGSSPTVGETCDSCLQKFTIHFRRCEDNIYDGSYGFDWYRPEYFKKLTYFRANTAAEFGKKVALVSGSIASLKATYTSDQISKISPFGTEYIPAWLAIYPFSQENMDHSNSLNREVRLNLELKLLNSENNFSLNNDGSKIKFEVSNPHIVIEPTELSIEDFIYANKMTRDLGEENKRKEETYYLASEIVKIKCVGPLQKHGEIIVTAIKGEVQEKVGKLMIYHNAVIPTLKVVFVDVVTDGLSQKRTHDYEDFLKNRSFNQALINVEITNAPEFDFRKYRKNDVDVNISLNKLNINDTSYFLSDLSKFYKKYQDKNLAIKNYVFVTNVSKKEGVGSGGESVVLLKCPQNIFNQVVVHELGHRFGLDHIFEAQKLTAKGSSFQFLRGTTANFLDYDHRKSDDNEKNNNKSKAIANPNLSLKYFFKYQWDLLRKRVK